MGWNPKYILPFVILFLFQLHVISNDGSNLFIENCVICHSIGQGDIVGPDLKNIDKKRSYKYFQSFVLNSQAVIKSGDSTAVSVYLDYDESIMPEHSLSESEITKIWQFIQTFRNDSSFEYIAPKVTRQTSYTWIVYILLFTFIATVTLLKRKYILLHFNKIVERIPLKDIFVKRWKGLAILVFVLLILFELNNNGIFTGYQPKQPILFSHEIHCAQNNISCKYCHSSAYKGEHGGIPPLASCMNCHKYVNKGTLTDTIEIQKLYDWVGYNYKLKEYNNEPKPKGWIKVYNLPDHTRFNHHIHTHANVSCTECHGAVEKMKEIKQVNSLTMKWCIDCHNKKRVPLVGYYSENEFEGNSIKAMRVDERSNYTLRTDTIYREFKNMGGLDCYKCHN